MSVLMWKPSEKRVKESGMFRFMKLANFKNYDELYRWSVGDIAGFWKLLWDFLDIKHSRKYDEVLVDGHKMPGAKWFPGARLNFAENLLRRHDNHPAIIFKNESGMAKELSYAELYDSVARLASSMRKMGIISGDRVAAFMPNIPETITAMLATASIGALWSSCSPDFGIKGVLDRFGQIKPKLLFAVDGYFYNGKTFDLTDRLLQISKELPSIQKTVIVPYMRCYEIANEDLALPVRASRSPHLNTVTYNDFVSKETGLKIKFEQLPFEHPLYIMYTSGTTGLPKCMVQSAGGVLINHLKELKLHTDVKREDRIFYFTTCGWMMWNWLTSSLALDATVMLYDGSPFYPNPDALFKFAESEKMTIFGTSARYIAAIEKEGLRPADKYDLGGLKTMLSTGSPLAGENFDYVYNRVKKDICLASISGGTDLNGCFVLGNPMEPVYRGEIQCRGLGMRVEAFDENGNAVGDQKGELVCTAPFPSMPLYFWNDEDGKKYHKAYFDVYPNVWRHGDFIRITKHGGVVIFGRSDATLNPGGVRIGTAEIYRLTDTLNEIKDCLAVGQRWKNDERVILFVKLAKGIALTDGLKNKIRTAIRANTTPRHVPAKIIKVEDIPYTINMKKMELAVRNVIHGEEIQNKDAMANPETLDFYKDIKELQED